MLASLQRFAAPFDLPPDPDLRPTQQPAWVPVALLAFVVAVPLGLRFLGSTTSDTLVAVIAALIGLFLVMLYRILVPRAFVERSDAAVGRLWAGELAEAEAELRALLPHFRNNSAAHANAVDALGVIALRRGDFEAACALFASALRHRRVYENGARAVGRSLSLTLTLMGDTARGAELLALVPPTGLERGWQLIPELALAARRGEYGEVIRRAEAEWATLTGAITGFWLRPIKAMLALALAETRRDPARLAELCRELAPLFPAELDFLGRDWPAMRELLPRFVRS